MKVTSATQTQGVVKITTETFEEYQARKGDYLRQQLLSLVDAFVGDCNNDPQAKALGVTEMDARDLAEIVIHDLPNHFNPKPTRSTN